MTTIEYRGSRAASVDARRIDTIEQEIHRVIKAISTAFFGWGQWTDVRVAGSYHAKPFDIVLCDPTAGGFTVLLPAPTTCLGAWVIIKNVTLSVNPITLRTDNGATVETAAAPSMTTALQVIRLRATYDGWWAL